jgi:hypothetical protein
MELDDKKIFAFAQRRANTEQTAMGIWRHVGDYGNPSGDIPARVTLKVLDLNRPDPAKDWALIATVDPEGV